MTEHSRCQIYSQYLSHTRIARQTSVPNAQPALSTVEGAQRHKDATECYSYALRPGIVAALRSIREKYWVYSAVAALRHAPAAVQVPA